MRKSHNPMSTYRSRRQAAPVFIGDKPVKFRTKRSGLGAIITLFAPLVATTVLWYGVWNTPFSLSGFAILATVSLIIGAGIATAVGGHKLS